jgi:hypothetical protein
MVKIDTKKGETLFPYPNGKRISMSKAAFYRLGKNILVWEAV